MLELELRGWAVVWGDIGLPTRYNGAVQPIAVAPLALGVPGVCGMYVDEHRGAWPRQVYSYASGREETTVEPAGVGRERLGGTDMVMSWMAVYPTAAGLFVRVRLPVGHDGTMLPGRRGAIDGVRSGSFGGLSVEYGARFRSEVAYDGLEVCTLGDVAAVALVSKPAMPRSGVWIADGSEPCPPPVSSTETFRAFPELRLPGLTDTCRRGGSCIGLAQVRAAVGAAGGMLVGPTVEVQYLTDGTPFDSYVVAPASCLRGVAAALASSSAEYGGVAIMRGEPGQYESVAIHNGVRSPILPALDRPAAVDSIWRVR